MFPVGRQPETIIEDQGHAQWLARLQGEWEKGQAHLIELRQMRKMVDKGARGPYNPCRALRDSKNGQQARCKSRASDKGDDRFGFCNFHLKEYREFVEREKAASEKVGELQRRVAILEYGTEEDRRALRQYSAWLDECIDMRTTIHQRFPRDGKYVVTYPSSKRQCPGTDLDSEGEILKEADTEDLRRRYAKAIALLRKFQEQTA